MFIWGLFRLPRISRQLTRTLHYGNGPKRDGPRFFALAKRRPYGNVPSVHSFPVPASPDRISTMPRPLTADDIKPLVALLTDGERIRLLRWITSPGGADTLAYSAAPPTRDEFSSEDEAIAWDADGWEGFH